MIIRLITTFRNEILNRCLLIGSPHEPDYRCDGRLRKSTPPVSPFFGVLTKNEEANQHNYRECMEDIELLNVLNAPWFYGYVVVTVLMIASRA